MGGGYSNIINPPSPVKKYYVYVFFWVIIGNNVGIAMSFAPSPIQNTILIYFNGWDSNHQTLAGLWHCYTHISWNPWWSRPPKCGHPQNLLTGLPANFVMRVRVGQRGPKGSFCSPKNWMKWWQVFSWNTTSHTRINWAATSNCRWDTRRSWSVNANSNIIKDLYSL